MTRITGIIVNLVPYHHARWEAFTKSSKMECHLVELTDQDAFKVLEFSAVASYQRHTLFRGHVGKTISAPVLRRIMAVKLDTLRPDVVCVSGWALPVSLAALDWAARNRVPVVMLSESNEFDEARSATKEFIKRRIVALCSAGLAGGKPQADYLVKLGLPRGFIFPGYDVVDNGYFAQSANEIRRKNVEYKSRTAVSELEQETANRKSGIGNQWELPEKYFLACARFGQKKNLLRLIEAYAHYRHLAKAGKEKSELWNLVIVGEGELRPEIEAAIKHFGVEQSVNLAGAKSYAEIPVHYAFAGAFIHASTTEQWGLVVNEAMACGLPVLVSNCCGCAQDLVHEGKNGFTFDPYDVEQLAELMLRISRFEKRSSAPRPEGGIQGEVSRESLADFGAESARIIAEWGPERFAQGLKAAAEKALAVGSKRAGISDRLLLRLLSFR